MLVCLVFCRLARAWARAWACFRIGAIAALAARGLGTMSIPVIGVGGLLPGEPIGAREAPSGLVVLALDARARPAA